MKDGKSFDILDMIEAAGILGIEKDAIIEHIRGEMYKAMKKKGIPAAIFTDVKHLTYAMRAALEGMTEETNEPEKKAPKAIKSTSKKARK
jgi:hypothetical protein